MSINAAIEKVIRGRLESNEKTALRLKIDYNLTQEYLESIITDRCPIFGFKIDWHSKLHTSNRHPRLVRIDLSKGIVVGNVIWVSQLAQNARSRFLDLMVEPTPKITEQVTEWDFTSSASN